MPRTKEYQVIKFHNRILNLFAGASFIMAAASWLIFNEQRRRARKAISNSVAGWTPTSRKRVGRVWRWIRDIWLDPWGRYRREVTSNVEGNVLEIGIASWPNLKYYGITGRLVGVEWKRRAIFAARRKVRRLRPGTEIVRARAEQLPFPNGSFDSVVTSLALCTVKDQEQVLNEIARILRPGGTLYFLEHIRSNQMTLAFLQDICTPLWRIFVDGCHPNRATIATMETAGFTITKLETNWHIWGLTRPTVYGTAKYAPPLVEQSTSETK
jgi:SAM-dependent methyltransferase